VQSAVVGAQIPPTHPLPLSTSPPPTHFARRPLRGFHHFRGDFFYKGSGDSTHAASGTAYDKWPVSNPGMHGFDEWHSTEASASSSTPNCGCNPAWPNEGQGCIIGGGAWTHQALGAVPIMQRRALSSHASFIFMHARTRACISCAHAMATWFARTQYLD
jgi:hypothetical protein